MLTGDSYEEARIEKKFERAAREREAEKVAERQRRLEKENDEEQRSQNDEEDADKNGEGGEGATESEEGEQDEGEKSEGETPVRKSVNLLGMMRKATRSKENEKKVDDRLRKIYHAIVQDATVLDKAADAFNAAGGVLRAAIRMRNTMYNRTLHHAEWEEAQKGLAELGVEPQPLNLARQPTVKKDDRTENWEKVKKGLEWQKKDMCPERWPVNQVPSEVPSAHLDDVDGILSDSGILVTETLDFVNSPVVARLDPGTLVSLFQVVGSRAQISRVHGDENLNNLCQGGWVSLMQLETGEAYLTKVLAESEDAIQRRKQVEAQVQSEQEANERKTRQENFRATSKEGNVNLAAALMYAGLTPMQYHLRVNGINDEIKEGDVKVTHLTNMVIIQRETVSGGWRRVQDPVWNKPYYLNPTTQRATWMISEVLHDGGLEDLLIDQTWHVGIVGKPNTGYEIDPDWYIECYDAPFDVETDSNVATVPVKKETGLPIGKRCKLKQGSVIVMQDIDAATGIARVVLPENITAKKMAQAEQLMDLCNPQYAVHGYCKACTIDGRPLVKNMVLDDRGSCLAGPFIADFPEAVNLPAQEDQDILSDPLGYVKGGDLVMFNLVAGIRAHVTLIPSSGKSSDIVEGWVTYLLPDGKALFREQTKDNDQAVAQKRAYASLSSGVRMLENDQAMSSDLEDTNAGKKKTQVPLVSEGFVLRWTDRVRAKQTTLAQLDSAIAADSYTESVVRDLERRKVLDLKYERHWSDVQVKERYLDRYGALKVRELPPAEFGGGAYGGLERRDVLMNMPEVMEFLPPSALMTDWKLAIDPLWKTPIWRSLWTDMRANIQQLLFSGAWKLHYVTAPHGADL